MRLVHGTRRVHPSFALVLAVALVAAGCMTFDTRTNPSYDGPPAYSGTRLAASLFGQALYALNLPFAAFFGADVGLSFVADTVLLPLTIPEQLSWSTERANALRTDIQQNSVIVPPQNEAPGDTATRLFRACTSLVASMSRTYLDCYDATAKITVVDAERAPRTFTGSEYKEQIAAYFEAARGGASFVRYSDPVFTVEDDRVRIKATRLDSRLEERTPIVLIVGPSADGQWRILEERSVGWR